LEGKLLTPTPTPKTPALVPGFFIARRMGVCIIRRYAYRRIGDRREAPEAHLPHPAPSPTPTPVVRRYAPIYRACGFVEAHRNGERRYVIERADGTRQALRPMQMHGLAFLLSLYPDPGYWRSRHPKRCRTGVDIQSAMASLIRACHEQGVYTPPA